MDTKGVPSFRSPVTTLNTHLPPSRHDDPISHVDFISAVISEFASVYTDQDKELKTNQVVESAVKDPKIWQGYDELKSWNWTYGQSPEFTHTIEGNFAVGDIVSYPHKHSSNKKQMYRREIELLKSNLVCIDRISTCTHHIFDIPLDSTSIHIRFHHTIMSGIPRCSSPSAYWETVRIAQRRGRE